MLGASCSQASCSVSENSRLRAVVSTRYIVALRFSATMCGVVCVQPLAGLGAYISMTQQHMPRACKSQTTTKSLACATTTSRQSHRCCTAAMIVIFTLLYFTCSTQQGVGTPIRSQRKAHRGQKDRRRHRHHQKKQKKQHVVIVQLHCCFTRCHTLIIIGG
jgi:hypothetical protein